MSLKYTYICIIYIYTYEGWDGSCSQLAGGVAAVGEPPPFEKWTQKGLYVTLRGAIWAPPPSWDSTCTLLRLNRMYQYAHGIPKLFIILYWFCTRLSRSAYIVLTNPCKSLRIQTSKFRVIFPECFPPFVPPHPPQYLRKVHGYLRKAHSA